MIKPRLKFLLLAVLFAAPLVAAWLMFFVYPDWQPEARLNYGTLISPARPLPELNLLDASNAPVLAIKGKWSLLVLGADTCDDACQQRLLLTRQVRLALSQNRSRVQRVYLAPSRAALAAAQTQLSAAHPDLVLLADEGAAGARVANFILSAQSGQPADPHAVYLLDPLGNWLMIYTGDIQPKGLHKDLKKLLRFSQIG